MQAMKLAPLLDDTQAMQIIEVIGDDIEPQAESIVLDDTRACYGRQGERKLEEVSVVFSDEANNEKWQVIDIDDGGMRGPHVEAEARASCNEGSSQVKFVSSFSVGAPLSGTAHRGQGQAAAHGGQLGAEVAPRAQLAQHGLDDSQFDGWSLQCEQEGFAAESEDPFATPP